MASVRPFERADIPQLVDLCSRAFPGVKPYPPEDYFEEFYFRTPCTDESIGSLVGESDNGRVVAFIGAMPRRFVLNERTVRVAVATKLMVDPTARSTAIGLKLANAFLSGAQDLTFADATNLPGCIFWQAFGAQSVWPYGVNWRCILRPAPLRGLRSTLDREALRPAGALASPFFNMLDKAAAARWRRRHPLRVPEGSCGDIDSATIVANMADMAGPRALRPCYDETSLNWLIRRAAAKTVNGKLKVMGVRDRRDTLIGWFIYYLKVRGTCILLQLVAKPNAAETVLDWLIADAAKGDAAAVSGRLEPGLVMALSKRSEISYSLSRYWTVAHTRDPKLMAAIHGGSAVLTKLDGEWSMAFHGEALDGEGKSTARGSFAEEKSHSAAA